MGDLITDETIEQGRFALYELERQLKLSHVSTASIPSSSNHLNLSSFQDLDIDLDINQSDSRSEVSKISERRLLDQLPRNTRLSNRQDSLGLTIEVSLLFIYIIIYYLFNISSFFHFLTIYSCRN